MSGRHDSRKRGRSRSPDRSRSGRSVSSKSRSGRDHRRDDNFKLPEPKTAEDKLTRILQGNTPRPQNEVNESYFNRILDKLELAK